MQNNLRNPSQSANILRRFVIYTPTVFFLGCAQCAFFPIIDICPGTPDLLLGFLIAVTLVDGERSAAICAICGGFFIDAIGGAGLAPSPIVYLFLVLIISGFAHKVLKSFISYILLLVPSLAYRAVATYAVIFIKNGFSLPPMLIFTDVLLPEAIATGLLCLPIYFIVKLCSGALETHSKFTF